MKKFFSILCALAIVLSASAVPAKHVIKLDKKALVKELSEQRVEKQAPVALNLNKVAKKSVKKVAHVYELAAPQVKKAKKDAVSFDILVDSITSFSAYVAVTPSDTTVTYYWDIFDAASVDTVSDADLAAYAKDYLDYLIEMNAYLGYAQTYADFLDKGFSDYMFDDLEPGTEYTVVAFEMNSVDGSLVGEATRYDFSTPDIELTGDTIYHDFTTPASFSYFSSYEQWSVQVSDSLYGLRMDIYNEDATSPAGVFEGEDFDIDYTYVKVAGEDGKLERIDALAAEAIIVDNTDSILVEAFITAVDGNVYAFSAFYAVPKKEAEDTIIATNLEVDDSLMGWTGALYLDASNEDFAEISFRVYPDSAYEGTYTIGVDAAGSLTTIEGKTIKAYSGSIVLEETEDGYAVGGAVLCDNNVEYTLDLTYVKPEKTREEVLEINDAKLVIYPTYGDWQVVGLTADSSRYIALDIVSTEVAGEYTIANVDAQYTYIYNLISRNDSLIAEEMYNPLDVYVTVAFNAADSTAVLTGTYLGQGYIDATDIPEFTFTINAKVSTYEGGTTEENEYDAEEDFIVNFDTYSTYEDYVAQYGVLFIDAQSNNNEYLSLELWLPEGASELVAGEYAVSATEGDAQSITAGEIDANEGQIYGSFAGTLNGGYINIPLWLFASGKVIVNEDGSIDVDALNTKGAAIKCHLGNAQGLKNVDAEATAAKRLVNGVLVIEKNGVLYNAQGAVVK